MPKVRVEKNGPVTSVTIDRPEARNAVDPETADELRTAFAAFEADDESAVAVLSGAGGHFCAGFDLKALSGGKVPYQAEGDGLMGIVLRPGQQVTRKDLLSLGSTKGFTVPGPRSPASHVTSA